MLTLKRFKALTDSYGADPERWPEAMRLDAEALLRASAEARRVLAQARALDEAIDASSTREEALRWPPGQDEAALARLRARVAARLADSSHAAPSGRKAATGRATPAAVSVRSPAAPAIAPPPPWFRWLRSHVSPVAQWPTSARVAGMAAAGGLIVAVGLLLGSMDVMSSTAQIDVLAMLQPNPLPFLADQ